MTTGENGPVEGVVGVPALDRPSLSVVGDDDGDDDDDDDGWPSVPPSLFTPDVAAAKRGEKMEEEGEEDEEEEDEGERGDDVKVVGIETEAVKSSMAMDV